MFTIKYIDENGNENLSEHSHVVADRCDDGTQRIIVFDEIPTLACDNHSGIFVERRESNAGDMTPRLFVMNRFGATVASYRL